MAILFTTLFPERVRTLVLAGTAAHLWPDEDPVTRNEKNSWKYFINRDLRLPGSAGLKVLNTRAVFPDAGSAIEAL